MSYLTNLYIVYDKIQNVSSNISYALSDLEAWTSTQLFIENKLKENSEYSKEDFDLVCVGTFDRRTGLIDPDYRLVTSSIVSDFKSKLKEERSNFLEFTKKQFAHKKRGEIVNG